MLNTLAFAAETIAPIFALILVGLVLKRKAVIGDSFISTSSVLVYRLVLPVMLFQRMSVVDSIPADLYLGMAVLAGATILVFIGSWKAFSRMEGPIMGSMVQGGFRGNITILGLAVIESSYGSSAVQIAVVFLIVLMPLFNFLAIVILSHSSGHQEGSIAKKVWSELIRNPLIWGILLGLPFGLLDITLPGVVVNSMDYVGRLTLPLALIGIGGSLNMKSLMGRKLLWSGASAIKLLVLPAFVWLLARAFSITGDILVTLVVFAACPTAVTSFVMAEALGADSELAGEIVSATTLFSMLTLTFWIGMLASFV
ncbi:MAG: AEC family transporter [Spirochaetia bacterium]|jgi:predicted permease|nr:AEC family transporter [Spirochaetia bacterium]